MAETAVTTPEPANQLQETVQETVKAIGETAEALGQNSEHLGDIGNIAAVASFAVIMGLIFVKLRQPPIVGYIAAGMLLGPTGLGLVGQTESITILAELGVLLLLFLIGMELSVKAFVMVLKPAAVIAGGQLVAGLMLTGLFGWALGWSIPQMLLLGFVIAVSSTAVAIKVLEDIGELRTETGRITVGVLIAQDIAIVPMLIIAQSLGGEGGLGLSTVVLILLAVGILGGLLWYLNRPGKLVLPFTRYFTGKPDLITLAMLAFCFTAAAISALLGLSAVYGAFLAGLVIANSTLRSEAIELTYPIQSILVFVFFLSIGLLIDLNYIISNLSTVLGFVLLAVIAKTALNVFLVSKMGVSWAVALPAGLAMAQIGEFSFILASVGIANRVLDDDTYRLALAVIAVTLMISPLWMLMIRRVHDRARSRLLTLREAMAIAYAAELEGVQRAGSAMSKARVRSRVYVRALRMAAHRRKAAKGETLAVTETTENDEADAEKATYVEGVEEALDNGKRDRQPNEK